MHYDGTVWHQTPLQNSLMVVAAKAESEPKGADLRPTRPASFLMEPLYCNPASSLPRAKIIVNDVRTCTLHNNEGDRLY